MKFKNTSGNTITVKYGDMITIQNGEVAELPLTYERPGLVKYEEVKIEKPKKVKKTIPKANPLVDKDIQVMDNKIIKPKKVKKSIFKK